MLRLIAYFRCFNAKYFIFGLPLDCELTFILFQFTYYQDKSTLVDTYWLTSGNTLGNTIRSWEFYVIFTITWSCVTVCTNCILTILRDLHNDYTITNVGNYHSDASFQVRHEPMIFVLHLELSDYGVIPIQFASN